MNNPPTEVVEAYVARKKAKGTYGKAKVHQARPDRVVLTGICPCDECGHGGGVSIVCDAEWNDCHCCKEICS